MSRYQSLNHSKFRLRYHLIFSTKYRRKCLEGIEYEVESVFRGIADEFDFSVVEVGVDQDHVHVVVQSKPTIAPVQIVRRLKQLSTRRLWDRNFDHLSRFYWGSKQGSVVWSGGYFCESIGPVQEGAVLDYVKKIRRSRIGGSHTRG